MKKIKLRTFLDITLIIFLCCDIFYANVIPIVFVMPAAFFLSILAVLILLLFMTRKKFYIKQIYQNCYAVLLPYDFLYLHCRIENGKCNITGCRDFVLHDLLYCYDNRDIYDCSFKETIFNGTKQYLSQSKLKNWGAMHLLFFIFVH